MNTAAQLISEYLSSANLGASTNIINIGDIDSFVVDREDFSTNGETRFRTSGDDIEYRRAGFSVIDGHN